MKYIQPGHLAVKALISAFTAGAVTACRTMSSHLSILLDNGFRIYQASSPEAMELLVGILAKNGYRPLFRIDSDGIDRVLFTNGLVVNCITDPDKVDPRLAELHAAIAIVSDDPTAAAEFIAKEIRANRHSIEIVPDIDTSVNPGMMVAVFTDLFAGEHGGFVVRRNSRVMAGHSRSQLRLYRPRKAVASV